MGVLKYENTYPETYLQLVVKQLVVRKSYFNHFGATNWNIGTYIGLYYGCWCPVDLRVLVNYLCYRIVEKLETTFF